MLTQDSKRALETRLLAQVRVSWEYMHTQLDCYLHNPAAPAEIRRYMGAVLASICEDENGGLYLDRAYLDAFEERQKARESVER